MLRAVFDTNILLRVFLARSGTIAAKLRSRLEDADYELILSPLTITELRHVLGSPSFRARHGRDEVAVDAFVRSLTAFSVVTPGNLRVDVPELLSRDPDDVAILSAAIDGGASFLVTQDKDLLDLGDRAGVRVIEPPTFLLIRQRLHGE